MVRASGVLNRQDGDLGRVALGNRGPDFPPQRVFVGEPLLQQERAQYAELDFGHVQPTAMLGGVVKSPAVWQSAGPLGRGRSRQGRHSVGVQVGPGPPGPPESPGRLHPPASASAGRNPAWYAVRSSPPAANRPEARRPGTGCGQPSAGTRSPAAGDAPAGRAARARGLGQQLGGGLVKADHRPFGS